MDLKNIAITALALCLCITTPITAVEEQSMIISGNVTEIEMGNTTDLPLVLPVEVPTPFNVNVTVTETIALPNVTPQITEPTQTHEPTPVITPAVVVEAPVNVTKTNVTEIAGTNATVNKTANVTINELPAAPSIKWSILDKVDLNKQGSYGYAIFYVPTGVNVPNQKVWVIDTCNTNSKKFDSAYHPDGTDIIGQNPDFLRIQIRPDGTSDMVPLPSGQYIVYVQNGITNHLETHTFNVGAGWTSYVAFSGNEQITGNQNAC